MLVCIESVSCISILCTISYTIFCFFFPLSSLYWVLSFEFLFFFSVFLKVPSAVCIYLICMVWEGFWNLHGFSILLESFGRVFVDTRLTAFIGGQFSWSLHQGNIGPRHSFDALPLYFLFTYLVVLGTFCLGCPALSL
jgi:hypothetical protein